MLHINYMCIIITVLVSKDIKVNVQQFSGFFMRPKFNLSLWEKRGFEAIRNRTRDELINRKTVKQMKLQAHGCI